jgi:hypothetical protein
MFCWDLQSLSQIHSIRFDSFFWIDEEKTRRQHTCFTEGHLIKSLSPENLKKLADTLLDGGRMAFSGTNECFFQEKGFLWSHDRRHWLSQPLVWCRRIRSSRGRNTYSGILGVLVLVPTNFGLDRNGILYVHHVLLAMATAFLNYHLKRTVDKYLQ